MFFTFSINTYRTLQFKYNGFEGKYFEYGKSDFGMGKSCEGLRLSNFR